MAGNAVQSCDVIGDVKDALMLRSAGARLKKNEGVLSKEGKRNVHSRRSQGVGSAYSVCVEEKVVRGHVKPRSNVVVGRNGGHLSGDIVDGLIDWRGRWRRMEVLK